MLLLMMTMLQVKKAVTALLAHLKKTAAEGGATNLLDADGRGTAIYMSLQLKKIPARGSLKPLRM